MSYTGIPVMLFSPPGLGKTATVKYLAEIKGVPYFAKSANKLTDVELMGIPYIQDKPIDPDARAEKSAYTKDLAYSLPNYIKELNKNPNGILFFDEITTAPESIQTMLLTIIQDCYFNEFKIPETTFRVCAGNYLNTVGTKQISQALMNRFCIFHIKPDVDFFIEGSESGWTNYEFAVINTDQEEILRKRMYYTKLRNKFLTAHRDLCYREPEEIIAETDYQFPTYRSWDNLVRALSILDGNDDEYIRCIIDGFVGPDVGQLFHTFMKSENKVFTLDLTKFVGKESEFKLPDPDKHDQVSYIMRSIMYLMKEDPVKYKELWKRVINVLHNKDNKYGDYTGYNNFIVQYINAGMRLVVDPIKDVKDQSAILKELNAEIDDWNELHSTNMRLISN